MITRKSEGVMELNKTEDVLSWLEQGEVCTEALIWIKASGIATARELWDLCPEPGWLMWVLGSKSADPGWYDRKEILIFLCDLVEQYAMPRDTLLKEVSIEFLRLTRDFLGGVIGEDEIFNGLAAIMAIWEGLRSSFTLGPEDWDATRAAYYICHLTAFENLVLPTFSRMVNATIDLIVCFCVSTTVDADTAGEAGVKKLFAGYIRSCMTVPL